MASNQIKGKKGKAINRTAEIICALTHVTSKYIGEASFAWNIIFGNTLVETIFVSQTSHPSSVGKTDDRAAHLFLQKDPHEWSFDAIAGN